ncbi:guanine nucleotide binding protein, alpha subunit, partial [Mycena galopus ATCC 62051]
IRDNNKRYSNTVKILLLGLSGPGKSTIPNQMKILTKGFEFDEQGRAKHRMTIYNNVLDCAEMLARFVRRVGLGALLEEMQAQAGVLLLPFPAPGGTTHAILTPALADAIWHISCVPEVGRVADEHPADFDFMDTRMRSFFSSIHRITDPAYVHNEKDVLHARAESTPCLKLHVFEVGLEREKWVHCFEGCHCPSAALLTVIPSHMPLLIMLQNHIHESLALFESIANSPWFRRTSVILFLNKIDVFKKKFPRM